MHKKLEDLTEIKNKLVGWTKGELDKEGMCSSPEEVEIMGEIIDMIKDLTEAEEKCWKACYYKEIVHAMDEAGEEYDREGYNTRRYASGRYAPAGRGHLGYTPMTGPYMMDDRMMREPDPYHEYKEARRHYTETHTPEDKRRMEQHADEHIHKATESIKDIWRDADPEMKTRLKSQMTKLVNEMN